MRSAAGRKWLSGLLIGSSLLLALALLGDWLPWLRGPAPETSEWYWPYLLRPVQDWWLAAAAALFLWLVAAWWIYQKVPHRAQNSGAMLLLFVASLLLQLGIIYADRQEIAAELIDRTLSNQASGFFEAAAEIDDLGQALASYPDLMPEFISEHARTHPPGLIAANWATIKLLERTEKLATTIARHVVPLRCADLWLLNRPAAVSAALGIWSVLPLLFAAATVFPAYAVAGFFVNDYAKRLAAVFAASLPALLLFAPKSVQLYAPLALLLFWSFHSGLLDKSWWRLVLAGFLLSLLTFLSFGNASLLLFLALYAILVLLGPFRQLGGEPRSSLSWKDLIMPAVAFGIGAVSIWLFYWAMWGISPASIAAVGLRQHYALVTNLRRYDWWVFWNLLDLIIFSGWPLALGFGGACVLILRRGRDGRLSGVDALTISLVIIILVLNLSGTARGEVGRLWLFFMPLLSFPAAFFWRSALPGRGSAAGIIGLQLLMLLCLGFAWQPVRAVIVVPEKPPMTAETPQSELNARFSGEPLTLQGYSLETTTSQSGGSLDLHLFWLAGGPASRPYTVFTHLQDTKGTIVAQQDNWPVNGTWPPTCWRSGDIIVDPYIIEIPPDTSPGSYELSTGLYDAASGERLRTVDGQDAVDLGTVQVISP